MKSSMHLAGSLVLPVILAACANIQGSSKPTAGAMLESRSGSQVRGTVSLQETGGGVRVMAQVSGLTPGEHGFHVHESGDCSAPDATSARGHFNPQGSKHGSVMGGEHHLGDMPNLVANANGEASYDQVLPGMSLSGAQSLIGRSFVIHADPDDYRSQPAGNSGKRVACGPIVGP